MAPRIPLTPALREEYTRLFATARIRPEAAATVATLVSRLLRPDHWARYEDVAGQTTVPAHVIALLHAMEAGLDFTTHLHNGDPLAARTVRVPKGRPLAGKPPFTWEESARDALELQKLPHWTDWSLAGIAYVLEGYNGWGYRLYHPTVQSPYLWGATTIYTSGKYVADGRWSASAASRQCGAMALLGRLVALGRVNPEGLVGDRHAVQETPAAKKALPGPVWNGMLLRPGTSGRDVGLVQARLRALGFGEIGVADGVFGPKTARAVRQFQRLHAHDPGAPLTVDGLVGPRTWQSLFRPDIAPAVQTGAAPRLGA